MPWRVRTVRSSPGATLVLENKTGRILAMVGGFSYPLSQLNRTSQAVRQPGSSIKPLIYLAALHRGLQPNTLILDQRPSPGQHVTNVVKHRTRARCDDANASRHRRQPTLPRLVKQALFFELCLQALELRLQRACAFRLYVVDDDLQLAALLVDANATVDEHRGSVLE